MSSTQMTCRVPELCPIQMYYLTSFSWVGDQSAQRTRFGQTVQTPPSSRPSVPSVFARISGGAAQLYQTKYTKQHSTTLSSCGVALRIMRMWLRASSKSCRGGSRVNLYVLLLACMLKTICGETTLTSIFRNTFVPSEVSGRLSGQKCADAPGVSNTTSCECRDGWTGPSCSIPEKIEHYLLCDLESSSVCKEHTNAPCAGRGSVSSDGNCVCDWGFIGSSCQTRGLPLPRTSVKGISVAEGGSALGEYTIVLEEPPVFGTVSVHVYAEGYGDDEEQDDVAKEAGPQVLFHILKIREASSDLSETECWFTMYYLYTIQTTRFMFSLQSWNLMQAWAHVYKACSLSPQGLT